MRRRACLVGIVGGAFITRARAATPAGIPTGGTLAFRVMRSGSEIGRHTVRFTTAGTRLAAQIDVALHVGLGPITLYHYHHRATEIWDDGAFTSFASSTDNDGTPLIVRATRNEGGVTIERGHGASLILRPETVPFTHWNIAVTRAPLFDPQDGVATPERVSGRGVTRVPLADGREVAADQFDFAGRATITDWYDPRLIWTALRARVPDGSILTYERL